MSKKRTRAELAAHLAEALAEIARLQGILLGEPMLKAVHFDEGQPLEVVLQHSIIKALASETVLLLEKLGGENFLTMDMRGQDGCGYELTIRRAGKKTPSQIIGELRAEIERLGGSATKDSE